MNKRPFGITPEQFEEFNNMTSEVPDMTAVTSESQPMRQPSPYDQIAFEETPSGAFRKFDMTYFLLHQEKTRRKLGDPLYQELLASMHPTQSTLQDNLTDDQRFDMVISRHCQTMSERQAVMDWLRDEHADLMQQYEQAVQESEQQKSADSAPGPAASE